MTNFAGNHYFTISISDEIRNYNKTFEVITTLHASLDQHNQLGSK